MKTIGPAALASALLLSGTPSLAIEVSHYAAGGPNLRDFMMPKESGLYVSSYNFYYQSGRLNDDNGRETPLPDTDPDLFADVDVYMMAVPFLLVEKRVFGEEHKNIDYAFLITPVFGNTSLDASLSIDGQNSQPVDSQFGFGDLYVQPLWLGFAPTGRFVDRFQFSLQWGFYAPTGKYDTDEDASAPSGRSADPDNIGAGFWTNQFRAAAQLNPWKFAGPAFIVAATYEVNSQKDRLHLTPGDHFTLNWGYSHLLPTNFGNWLVDFGPAGYNSWQATSDNGRGRANGDQDEVHAVGFQLGLVEACALSAFYFHYFYEYEAEDRFQGHVLGLSFSVFFDKESGYRLKDHSSFSDELKLPCPEPGEGC
jgi:hypothetical protein